MTERALDESLREICRELLAMAGAVERAIEHATRALIDRDAKQIPAVMELENKINRAHLAVDDACVKLLALQQPLAADLRLIVAVIKINTDLERMGDQAVNIAHNAQRYLKFEPLKPLVDLPKMADEVREMVRLSLDAFVKRSEELANRVLLLDDSVDEAKNRVFTDVLTHLKTTSAAPAQEIEPGLCLILIARNLERVGDHATNIAEDVIFAVSGRDIRHAHAVKPEGEKK